MHNIVNIQKQGEKRFLFIQPIFNWLLNIFFKLDLKGCYAEEFRCLLLNLYTRFQICQVKVIKKLFYITYGYIQVILKGC